MALDFEKEKLITELKKLKPKKVLVQLPEGIKRQAIDISKIIKSLGIEVIISGETCWGGCCVDSKQAELIGVDLIIHFGHAEFIKVDYPVLYIEVKDILNLNPILKKSLETIKNLKTIGLSYSIQHRHDLDKIIEFYKNAGKRVILSKKHGKVAYEGHIVGCQYEGLKNIESDVDGFVIIGNNFHSMGASIAVEKPIFLIDVYNDEVREMKEVRDKIIRERAISIEKFKNAKKIGIIQEARPGQLFGNAGYLLKEIEKTGKQGIIIEMNEMTPDKLMNFYDIDAFVEIACPRIAVDDFFKYEKPIITYKEALIGIGKRTWEESLKKGLL